MPALPDQPFPETLAASTRSFAADLCADIDASPSPFHAVDRAAHLLEADGFVEHLETDSWSEASSKVMVRRDGAFVACLVPDGWTVGDGIRVVGAHTDSPNLRIKPKPDVSGVGFRQVGVEVYGGVLLNSWLDRDLGYSGRIALRDGTNTTMRLLRVDEPIFRVPQLAIHLDSEISTNGLKLNKQEHMVPVYGLGAGSEGDLRAMVAAHGDVAASDILSYDLMLHDLAPPALVGLDRDMIASARIDNQLSCFVALAALRDAARQDPNSLVAVALFDHEEVGSTSSSGAASPLLGSVLRRLVGRIDDAPDAFDRAIAASCMVSADGAHATHPNYASRHEPGHTITIGDGPVLKHNANERYATSARSAALFLQACERAEVPVQHFVNRSDLRCGSTIGPIASAELGLATVDVGCAQLAMHSIREMCGVQDARWFGDALTAFLAA